MIKFYKTQEKNRSDLEKYISNYKKSKPAIVFNSWKIDEKPLDFINKVEHEKFRFQKIRNDLISGRSRISKPNTNVSILKNAKTEGNLEGNDITSLSQLKDFVLFD